MPPRFEPLARATFPAVCCLILSTLALLAVAALSGRDPGAALTAILAGSVGSPDSLVETILRATPLVFTGLSVALAFRAGIWNIGAEGQFLMGMLASVSVAAAGGAQGGWPVLLAALAAGAAAGAAWAGIAAWMLVRRGAPEVITTILLNFIAVYAISFLVRGPLRDPTSISDWSRQAPNGVRLPHLLDPLPFDLSPWNRLHFGVLIALACGGALAFFLARARGGYQMRLLGASSSAARHAGMSVGAVATRAMLLSGLVAGLGGAVELTGVVHRLYNYAPGAPGYGYSGIAVALVGGLHPAGSVAAGLFFGALDAGCSQMQRSAGISSHVAYVIQGMVVLAILIAPRAPAGRLKKPAIPDGPPAV